MELQKHKLNFYKTKIKIIVLFNGQFSFVKRHHRIVRSSLKKIPEKSDCGLFKISIVKKVEFYNL